VNALLYVFTCLTTLLCALLLLRAYTRVRKKLLLWSGLCFVGLTLTNLVTIMDLVFLPNIDLFTYRLGITAVSMVLLLYGLIWESQ
jgi:hypothetical protein